MPRGGEGYWIITTDENGIVNGTMEPEVIDGKAYWRTRNGAPLMGTDGTLKNEFYKWQ